MEGEHHIGLERIVAMKIGGRDDRDASLSYNGLGGLIRASGTGVFSSVGEERFVLDALGNRTWKRHLGLNPSGHIDQDGERVLTYDGAGRLQQVASDSTSDPQQFMRYVHDASGNQVAVWGWETKQTSTGLVRSVDQTRSYYGADQKLRLLNRHVGPVGGTSGPGGIYEEYRYDALGRRVLVRSRPTSACSPNPCKKSYLERTVWAGDQVLAEIRAPGSADVTESAMESESPAADAAKEFAWGRVHYTHGLGIDAPLAVSRTGLSGHPSVVTVFPHANWQGEFENGSMVGGGLHSSCSGSGCPPITWPAVGRMVDGGVPPGVSNSPSWFGSLIAAKTDGSGLQYMRNRYYDPATGRFTQEDPIGLAGGLNLYGYAGGDPVNFSDPFGLMACPPLCDNLDYRRDRFIRAESGKEAAILVGAAFAAAAGGLAIAAGAEVLFGGAAVNASVGLAGAGTAGGMTLKIVDALQKAGPDMGARTNAVLSQVPKTLDVVMRDATVGGQMVRTISGGTGDRLREFILRADGSTTVRAFDVASKSWKIIQEIPQRK